MFSSEYYFKFQLFREKTSLTELEELFPKISILQKSLLLTPSFFSNSAQSSSKLTKVAVLLAPIRLHPIFSTSLHRNGVKSHPCIKGYNTSALQSISRVAMMEKKAKKSVFQLKLIFLNSDLIFPIVYNHWTGGFISWWVWHTFYTSDTLNPLKTPLFTSGASILKIFTGFRVPILCEWSDHGWSCSTEGYFSHRGIYK